MSEKFHFHRFEFKYLVDQTLREALLRDILIHMRFDLPYNTGNAYYEVLNLYLDSHDLRFYREKIDGLMFRKKLRFRFYTSSPSEKDHFFIEIKRKRNMTIIKDRVKVPYSGLSDILRNNVPAILKYCEDAAPQEKEILEEFLFEKMKGRLENKVWVNYRRTALAAANYPKLRVTFDDNICAKKSLGSIDGHAVGNPYRMFHGKSVLEIKYNGTLPYWLYAIIRKYQLFREPISKYCNAVEGILL